MQSKFMLGTEKDCLSHKVPILWTHLFETRQSDDSADICNRAVPGTEERDRLALFAIMLPRLV
jgi:hypothetical protein